MPPNKYITQESSFLAKNIKILHTYGVVGGVLVWCTRVVVVSWGLGPARNDPMCRTRFLAPHKLETIHGLSHGLVYDPRDDPWDDSWDDPWDEPWVVPWDDILSMGRLVGRPVDWSVGRHASCALRIDYPVLSTQITPDKGPNILLI